MLNRLFPRAFDNAYRGHALAIWLFVPVVLLKAVQGANSIVITRTVATGADGIPLDRFDPQAAQTVIALFALLGFHLLILPLQSLVVLIRYRAMIPFMFLMLLVMQLGGRLVLLAHPVARSGDTPMGLYINLAILAATVTGFVLSLSDKSKSAQ
jgi:hypothetical protein